jgi:hypothetical protein
MSPVLNIYLGVVVWQIPLRPMFYKFSAARSVEVLVRISPLIRNFMVQAAGVESALSLEIYETSSRRV